MCSNLRPSLSSLASTHARIGALPAKTEREHGYTHAKHGHVVKEYAYAAKEHGPTHAEHGHVAKEYAYAAKEHSYTHEEHRRVTKEYAHTAKEHGHTHDTQGGAIHHPRIVDHWIGIGGR
jgi:hypothetical protein